ncbi:hypothetical protein EC2845650_1206 [Escherichia coli 2845650]|nr:hypothetical protein EC2845650_1206 [Escherichia coli 2845650]
MESRFFACSQFCDSFAVDENGSITSSSYKTCVSHYHQRSWRCALILEHFGLRCWFGVMD